MRLFIAINLCEQTRSQLLSLQYELIGMSKHGKFTEPENLHLTLVFLGECNTTESIVIKKIINTEEFQPFALIIDSIGRFKREGGDLWWAGVHRSKALNALHGNLTGRLIEAGFTIEKRRYKPHITLGREIVTHAKPRKIETFGETVSSIDLMKSERLGGKVVYTPLKKIMK